MLEALVAAVPKNEDAKSPNEFRPIVLLSLVYRAWSGLRMRQILVQLCPILPSGIFGFRTGLSTADEMLEIMLDVEHSILFDHPLAGLTADLVKCFNNLPRELIFLMADHIGIPRTILRPWLGMIAKVKRRFVFHGGVSDGVGSIRGFPEGDSLSIIAMLLFNIVWHLHVQNKITADLTSGWPKVMQYVDSNDTIVDSSRDFQTMLDAISEISTMVDVPLDHKKTNAWSTHVKLKQSVKQMTLQGRPLTFVRGAKNLGYQVSFTNSRRISTLAESIDKEIIALEKIRALAIPHDRKLAAILGACFPRALHPIGLVQISLKYIDRLRSALKSALNHKHHSNPNLILNFFEARNADPLRYLVIERFRHFYKSIPNSNHKRAQFLDIIASRKWGSKLPGEGPVHSFLEAIKILKWCVDDELKIVTTDGLEFDLLDTSKTALFEHVNVSWHQKTIEDCSHRRDVGSERDVCLRSTQAFRKVLDPSESKLLAVTLGGSNLTQDRKYQMNDTNLCDDPCCPCGEIDSREHRVLHCPLTVKALEKHPLVASSWESLPLL